MRLRTIVTGLIALAAVAALSGCIFVEKGGRGGHCWSPPVHCR